MIVSSGPLYLSNQPGSLADEGSIDLHTIFRILVARRWWILVSVVLFSAAFAIAAYRMTPVYRASVLLIPASAERNSLTGSMNSTLGQLGGIAAMAGLGLGNSDIATEEALAVLRSRQFTVAFIEDNHLMPALFSARWDSTRLRWREPSKQPTESRAFDYFNSKIRSVIQDKKTGLVTMQVEWTDRFAAANWANTMVDRINAEMRKRAIDNADASLGYLQKELGATSTVEVRDAINRLIESQVKQRMLANVSREYAFRVVDQAVAPDLDRPIRPDRTMLLLLGPMLGLGLGIFVSIMGGAFGGQRL